MMDEKVLLRILKQEDSDASSYHDSELARAQEQALNHYFAKPYGDEVPGRSKIVTHDIEDAINWIMPDLMRCFAASDDLVSCKADKPEDDSAFEGGPDGKSKADIMAAYLSHIYFNDNPGDQNTHDFLFDGLLSRIGILSVEWEDPDPEPSQTIEGLGAEQVVRYAQDPEYQILGYDQEQGPNGPVFTLEVQRKPKMGRPCISVVPPEEFALHKAARSIEDAKYSRRKRLSYVSELARQYPDKKQELLDRKSSATEPQDDARYQARHPDDNIDQSGDALSSEGRRECWLLEEFLRIDYDGDGIVELRHVKRVDDIVLENVAVKYPSFVTWTPIRVSHRAVGRSLDDVLGDLQKIRTVITRAYLDGLQQTVTPRTAINTMMIDQDGLDALAENPYGAVIPVKGDPAIAIRETVTPDISGPALNALEYFDQRGQVASGVTMHSQGMDPAALNKTATGIDLLQAAAKTRVEMIARWAGSAFEQAFRRILHLVVAHQDGPRMVKLFGAWVEVDPRTWSDEMAVAIDVGSAGVSKAQRIMNLMQIAAKQEQVLVTAGPGNPLVSLQHLRNSYAALASDMGFADPSLFFGQIPPDWQPPPQQDPKVEEAKAKLQIEQAKAQADAQRQDQKLQADMQTAQVKLQSEYQIAQQRMTQEMQIAREKMVLEAELAREKAQLEFDLAERDSQRQHEVGMVAAKAKARANGSGSPKISTNRPGGDLAS